MDLRGYLRRARALPPHAIIRKAGALGMRVAKRQARLIFECFAGSYGAAGARRNPKARISIAAGDIPADLEATLRVLWVKYLQHRFDLLGSGWVAPIYGFRAEGFLGHRFAPTTLAAPDKAGNGIEAIVNRSNRLRSRQIWCLISRHDYTPIDWQLDFRSGYRWSACRHSYRLAVPVDIGADVKVPWELGRLQHLPQLVLCAILAGAGRAGFEPAERYVQEIADQLMDFIATNPPRFGANWMCPMDVSIRAANIALTLALLSGAGFKLGSPVEAVVLGALCDHAAHVLDHLEYSETGRSNHYIADIAGVLWASWLLDDDDSQRRLAFAIAEILKEIDVQFLPDGGNYEGSTNYHRLSTEMALFAMAVILSLDEAAVGRLDRISPPRRAWRVEFPKLPFTRYRDANGGTAIVPPVVISKLGSAAGLSRAVQGDDGTAIQIGDTDSGRFFKLHPTALPSSFGASAGNFVENTLDHSGVVDMIDVLSGAASSGRRMDAIVADRIAGGNKLRDFAVSAPDLADFGDIDALIARCEAVPEQSRRVRQFSLGQTVGLETWTRAAFPDFGLYVFRQTDGRLISFRCFQSPPVTAPRGHLHDDNLGIEYRLGNISRRDPGSFVYTPSISIRNQYRAAAAHDVPRAREEPIAVPDHRLFDLDHKAFARCLAWRPDEVAGEIAGPSGRVLRVIRISRTEITVWDCVDPPGVLDVIPPEIEYSSGYGRH